MKLHIIEDVHDIVEQDYHLGSLVVLKDDYKFKQAIMRQIVARHHVFVIMDVDEDNRKYLVYAMTSQLDRLDKYPKFYHKVKSGYKWALVQLNAWGWVPFDSVDKEIASLSFNDFKELLNAIDHTNLKRTTICEKDMNNF